MMCGCRKHWVVSFEVNKCLPCLAEERDSLKLQVEELKTELATQRDVEKTGEEMILQLKKEFERQGDELDAAERQNEAMRKATEHLLDVMARRGPLYPEYAEPIRALREAANGCAEKRNQEPPCPSGIRGENSFSIPCYREANHCGCHIGKKADGTDTSWND